MFEKSIQSSTIVLLLTSLIFFFILIFPLILVSNNELKKRCNLISFEVISACIEGNKFKLEIENLNNNSFFITNNYNKEIEENFLDGSGKKIFFFEKNGGEFFLMPSLNISGEIMVCGKETEILVDKIC